MNYEKHPLNIYPEINKTTTDYEELKASISNGYDKTYPIELYEEKIIDGWNRYLICKELDITPTFRNISGKSYLEIIELVRSRNARRNLSDDAKVVILAKLHVLEQEYVIQQEAKKKMSEAKIGNNNASKEKTSVADNKATVVFEKPSNRNIGREQVAKQAGVGKDKAQQAITLVKNNPELAEKVMNQETTFAEIKKEEKKKKFEENIKSFKSVPLKKGEQYDIYHGDCLDYIKTMEDATIDLMLTDPPYGMDFKSGWVDKSKIQNDKIQDTIPLFESMLNLVKPKLKDDAHVYIFGNIYYMEDLKPIIDKYLNLHNILIWDRKIIGMGNLQSYGSSYDIIYFCSNKKWKNLNGTRERDVLQFERVSPSNLIHPTEKPIDLLEFLIKKSSSENDLVFDPFAGGGSSIVASLNLNRKIKACELEENYIGLIKTRINN